MYEMDKGQKWGMTERVKNNILMLYKTIFLFVKSIFELLTFYVVGLHGRCLVVACAGF